MNDIFNSALIWVCIGFVFFVLEFAIPGFILFFFGIGAWLVAGICFFFDISINTQIILFIASSLLSVLLFRNWLRQRIGGSGVNFQQLEDEYIGKVAKAETAIGPEKNGKVEFRGASWEARSNDIIIPGENVVITETQSILLIVKSIKSL
ncbi:MAG: NfeD family protein [Pedobacter sp.]|jgi:membrane protein implicated in regulation of membrane protease activity|nr:MAG: NfeD family protein [Pedobacter sp.]